MKNKCFYLDGDLKKGPFLLEDLPYEIITKDTYIWISGMEKWEKISDIPEAAFYLSMIPPDPPRLVPPPIPKVEPMKEIKALSKKDDKRVERQNIILFIFIILVMILSGMFFLSL